MPIDYSIIERLIHDPEALNHELTEAFMNDPTLYGLRAAMDDLNVDQLTALRTTLVILAKEKAEYLRLLVREKMHASPQPIGPLQIRGDAPTVSNCARSDTPPASPPPPPHCRPLDSPE